MKNVKVYVRAILSASLLSITSVLVFTGVGLYLAPSGRIARETGWNFWGLSKLKLEEIHTKMGFFLCGVSYCSFSY